MKMSKSLTPIDEYRFTLSDELKRMAEVELRETKSTRDNALRAIREWIQKNPRIELTRMDASFLLRFLRTKKFSIPMAQENIERFILLRHAMGGIVFQNFDVALPRMIELIDLGYMFVLPKRDHLGRRIIFYRPGVFDPVRFENLDMVKIHGITYGTLVEDEENHIRGYVHLVDCANLGLRHMTLFTPKEAVRIVKNGEKIIPMRHKEVIAFNIHPSIKFAVDFGMALLSEKMRKRIKFYRSIDSWKSLNRALLPKEYGGEVPMAVMTELWKKEAFAQREVLLAHDRMSVRLEMYSGPEREGAVSALRHPIGYGNDGDNQGDNYTYGLKGSFRKLELD